MTTTPSAFEGPASPVVDWETNRPPPLMVRSTFVPTPRLGLWPASVAPIGKTSMPPPLGSLAATKPADQTPRNGRAGDVD